VDERILNGYLLIRCSECSFVFADVSFDEVRRHNYHVSSSTDSFYRQSQTELDDLWFWSVACRVARKAKTGKVLDVGCGNGMLLKHFKSMGWDCFGLDVSPWAKRYAEEYGYVLYDEEIERNYLPDNYFDLIVSTSTLEHIYDPVNHVKAMLRVLKPGGYIYVAGVPNYGSVTVRMGVSKFYLNTPPAHINYFTPLSLGNLLLKLRKYYEISFRIRTYGIPDTFYVYHRLRKFFVGGKKKSAGRGESESKKGAFPQIKEKDFRKICAGSKDRSVKIFLYKFLVLLNYFSGRPFNLGDKIEVLIRKEC